MIHSKKKKRQKETKDNKRQQAAMVSTRLGIYDRNTRVPLNVIGMEQDARARHHISFAMMKDKPNPAQLHLILQTGPFLVLSPFSLSLHVEWNHRGGSSIWASSNQSKKRISQVPTEVIINGPRIDLSLSRAEWHEELDWSKASVLAIRPS